MFVIPQKMNVPRIKLEGRAFYHCISRVVDRRIVFHADEKEVFRSILRKLETFTGVRVVTYCLMGNHFHLLLEVPERGSLPALDATRLFEILPLLYDKATVETIAAELDMARKAGDLTHEKNLLERYEHRRGDLSVFLKELKQRVSIFINRRLGRAAAGGAARSTSGDAGSIAIDHASRNGLSARRVLITTWTGPAGSGNRIDSWKARDTDFASSVVSHSP